MVKFEELVSDLLLLSKNFYKVIEVNLNEDSYFEVKLDDREPHVYSGLQKWIDAFATEGGVYPDDVDRFRKFFDPFKLKDGAPKWQRVYYRRKINDEWRYVCMEVIPFENFTPEDAIVLVVVRDVEDYIKDYKEQVK